MPIRRVLCAILFAVGYLGSIEAQEAPDSSAFQGLGAQAGTDVQGFDDARTSRSRLRSLCRGARHCKWLWIRRSV